MTNILRHAMTLDVASPGSRADPLASHRLHARPARGCERERFGRFEARHRRSTASRAPATEASSKRHLRDRAVAIRAPVHRERIVLRRVLIRCVRTSSRKSQARNPPAA